MAQGRRPVRNLEDLSNTRDRQQPGPKKKYEKKKKVNSPGRPTPWRRKKQVVVLPNSTSFDGRIG
jgi:hypothetical protein